MCGICGFVDGRGLDSGAPDLLKRMTRTLIHRGPDDEGFHIDGQAALGMRRLSIIDLVTGRQPMANEDRTVWVVMNGEIYNFPEIRKDLLARGHVLA
ncbi:MAG: asparagine synthetase B, partial [Acidobacteria bacterium]|nr:asparagine synthetase B [Acidobacteriota bacterium]